MLNSLASITTHVMPVSTGGGGAAGTSLSVMVSILIDQDVKLSLCSGEQYPTPSDSVPILLKDSSYTSSTQPGRPL